MSSSRWKAITPSGFVWEQEGLNYIRKRLPDRDPYRAWSNFEFIAADGHAKMADDPLFLANQNDERHGVQCMMELCGQRSERYIVRYVQPFQAQREADLAEMILGREETGRKPRQ